MNGKGTPTTGKMPLTMPMLTNAYVNQLSVMAPASKRVNTVGASAAIISPRKIRNVKPSTRLTPPIRPNSSENAAKMKSVVRSGMNSRCVCVPFMKPLPSTPPEPMAIIPWMMWKPLPSGSVVGSSSVQTRFFW